jgi:flagellar biosynthesis protein FlhG
VSHVSIHHPATISELAELDRLIAPSVAELERWFEQRGSLGGRDGHDQAASLRRLMQDAPGPAPSVAKLTSPQTSSPRTTRNPREQDPLPRTSHRACKTVVVASGKGGVGKTTLAVNLAIALAQRGLRVTLLDADFGTANADLLLGLTPNARLDHLLAPDGDRYADAAPRQLRDIAIDAPGGFQLIPGSSGIAHFADLGPAQRAILMNALSELDDDRDLVLIDAGAGVGSSVTSLMAAADQSIVVATPEPTSIADAYALVKCLLATGADAFSERSPRVSIVMNQIASLSEAQAVHARIEAVTRRFLAQECPLLGAIAQDVRVPEAVRARQALLLRSPSTVAATQVRDVADRLARQLGLLGPSEPVRGARTSSNADRGGIAGLFRRIWSGSGTPAQIDRR